MHQPSAAERGRTAGAAVRLPPDLAALHMHMHMLCARRRVHAVHAMHTACTCDATCDVGGGSSWRRTTCCCCCRRGYGRSRTCSSARARSQRGTRASRGSACASLVRSSTPRTPRRCVRRCGSWARRAASRTWARCHSASCTQPWGRYPLPILTSLHAQTARQPSEGDSHLHLLQMGTQLTDPRRLLSAGARGA